jgi:hypothetical protein
MGKLAKAVGNLFTGGQIKRAEREQKRIAAENAKQKSKQDAVEAGQRRANAGGGFLGYIDEQLKDKLG